MEIQNEIKPTRHSLQMMETREYKLKGIINLNALEIFRKAKLKFTSFQMKRVLNMHSGMQCG